MSEVTIKSIKAKEASLSMALVSTEVKNNFLKSLAMLLREQSLSILGRKHKRFRCKPRFTESIIDGSLATE